MNIIIYNIRRIVFFLREFFFPAGCALCNETLLDMKECWYGLCSDCHSDLEKELEWLDKGDLQNRCTLCGKPMVSGKNTCLACRNEAKPSYDRMLCIFNYSGKYKKLFAAYKFGKNLALGHFFAEIFIKAVKCFQIQDSEQPHNIVPIPPRPGKIKESGWDQIEYLAKLIEADWQKHEFEKYQSNMPGIHINRCLKRLSSKVQKKLDRQERKKNLKGKMVLIKKAPQTAIIIDDVITTGSTMETCASVLKTGGSSKIYGICIVYD